MRRIKFYGIGGQGAVTAAKVLSQAVSIYQDEYAITVPAYGHERRGAPVYAHIIVDETIIDKGIHVGEGCHRDTVLVLNTASGGAVEKYRSEFDFKAVYWSDATGAALRNIGMAIPNSAMLGALARTGVVGIDAVEKAILDSFGKVGEQNVRAAREAYEHTAGA